VDLKQQLLAAFDAEHREHIEALRRVLDGAARAEAVDVHEIFRCAHTLKGAARAVDMTAVEALAHDLEALLAEVEEGTRALDPTLVADVQARVDAIEEAAAQALAAEAPKPPPAPVETPPKAAPSPATPEPPEVPEPAANEPAPDYVRVAAQEIDALATAFGELSSEVQAHQFLTEGLRGMEGSARRLGRAWERIQRHAADLARDRGPDSGLGPALSDFEHDLKALTRELASVAARQRRGAWALEQANRAVRDTVDRVSLVPVSTVFGAFGKVVRDIARGERQEVTVRLHGLDIRAERNVLQKLKDPVMHLVRNAIGHGAESAEARAEKGKPVRLAITITFETRGGRLMVRVEDDGRGPDVEKVRRIAVARGWMPPSAEYPAEQVLAFAFQPGFSTAEQVDRLSGRGMGLAIVAEAARALRGTVLLRPGQPFGSEAVISVPLSAALQTVLIVESEGRLYALPSFAVERLLQIPVDALESTGSRPAFRYSAADSTVILPLLSLPALVGSAGGGIPAADNMVRVAVLRRGQRRCALAVDELRDVRTVIVSEASALGIDPDIVSGSTLMEDGAPALVLNPESVMQRALREQIRPAGAGIEERPQAAPTQRTVLVVDDSITTRTLQKSILEAQGYRVILSVDGIDALERLRGDILADVVIADIEMPRMDGFALLQAMKSDSRLKTTPVVLMTSRAAAEDIRRGLDLGAAAYLTKQKFDQSELLATIGQLL